MDRVRRISHDSGDGRKWFECKVRRFRGGLHCFNVPGPSRPFIRPTGIFTHMGIVGGDVLWNGIGRETVSLERWKVLDV